MEAALHERTTETFPTLRGGDRQMVQVPAATIVAAQDGSRQQTLRIERDKTEPGIPFKKPPNRLARIGFVQADPLASAPEC